MGSFMDFVAGAGAGAGGALENVGEQMGRKAAELDLIQVRKEAEMDRDRALSALRTGEQTHQAQTNLEYGPKQRLAEQKALAPGVLEEAQGKSDIAVEEARRKPRTIAAGATEKIGDQTYTAPEKPPPPEQLDYYRALANRWNAEADLIRSGGKDKTAAPSLKVDKDADGNTYMVDEHSGAIGVIRPGAPAVPPQSHWFSPDEPGKPAGAPAVDWTLHGQPLPGGLPSLYPALRSRMGGGEAQQLAPVTPPQAAIDALRKDPTLAEQFRQKYNADPSRYLPQSAQDPLGLRGSGASAPGFTVYPADIEAAQKDPAAYERLAEIVGGKQTLDNIIADYATNPDRPQTAPRPFMERAKQSTSAPQSSTTGTASFADRQSALMARLRAIDTDPELQALMEQHRRYLRAGKAVEANNALARYNDLVEEKYPKPQF